MNLQTQQFLARHEAQQAGELTPADAKAVALYYHYGVMGNTHFYGTELMAEAAGRAFQRQAVLNGEGIKSSRRREDLDTNHPVYGQVYAAYQFDY